MKPESTELDERKFKDLVVDIRDKLSNATTPKLIHDIYKDLHTLNILVSLKLKNTHGGKYFEDYYFNLYGVVNKKLNKIIGEQIVI